MFSISTYRNPSPKQLRSFGLILATGFFIIGAWRVVWRHASPVRSVFVLSLFFAATGILFPRVLRPIHRLWMALGNTLGWVNSKIVLGVLYYVVFTPVSLAMSLAGRDPMNRRFDPKMETYRVLRTCRSVSHMKRQF